MMLQAITQEIELWETWIEYDPTNPEFFGMLYVLGEVLDDHSQPALISRINDGAGRLSLRIPEPPIGKCRRKEVMYSEPIRNLDQYRSVRIYSGQELIACFEEIEVLI